MPDKKQVTRKLSAILSADVKGYSVLMADDEIHTIETLKFYRQIISDLISEHSGRVVDSPGDNILAEFSSVVNAVECAVEIQKRLKSENDQHEDDKKLQYRIGVNIGDVVQDGDRIYGNGVNVAARIEGLAEPGGICVSRNAYDHISDKLNYGYEYLGEHTVKNIKKPIRVYKILLAPEDAGKLIGDVPKKAAKKWVWATAGLAVIMIISVTWQVYQKIAAPEFEPASIENMSYPLPNKPSIAVLPFDNMSEDPKQEYFSDGITENIIMALSKSDKLFVIARNSTFIYKGKPVKVKQVAEELGVRYVLEGSILKSEDRVRVTAQLIDAVKGNHLWAERYDREFKDIFALQDEITWKILTALHVELTSGEQVRMWANKFKKLEVGLKHLEAVSLARKGTKESFIRYGQVAREIIDMAPEDPHGYNILGWYYWLLAARGISPRPQESFVKAFELAQKALSIDESIADPHALLSNIYLYMRQYEKAITAGERAVVLEPNGAMVHTLLGSTLCYAGRADEGINEIKQGIRLNPIPDDWYFRYLGLCYRQKGQYEEALTAYQNALQLNQEDRDNHLSLAAIYALLDRQEEAEASAKKVMEIDSTFSLERFSKKAPYKNPDDLKLLVDALKKAGLK